MFLSKNEEILLHENTNSASYNFKSDNYNRYFQFYMYTFLPQSCIVWVLFFLRKVPCIFILHSKSIKIGCYEYATKLLHHQGALYKHGLTVIPHMD